MNRRTRAPMPEPIKSCPATTCPKCGARSPCFDHTEVDVGVGVITGEHSYCCPTHGKFGFTNGPPYEVVFRDDQPPPTPEEVRESEDFFRAMEDKQWRPK